MLLIPFLAAAVILWRRRLREPCLWLRPTLLALGLGVLAVSRTIGRISAYRLQWTWVLAMIACLVTVWTGWLLDLRPPASSREVACSSGSVWSCRRS